MEKYSISETNQGLVPNCKTENSFRKHSTKQTKKTEVLRLSISGAEIKLFDFLKIKLLYLSEVISGIKTGTRKKLFSNNMKVLLESHDSH